jgi:hypothetical protein
MNKPKKQVKNENLNINVPEPFLTEDYKYEPNANEQLIVDRPSRPVKVKTNKDIYDEFLQDKKDFEIYFRGEILFDSSLSSRDSVRFEEDHFYVFDKQHNYGGVRIVKKNK